jgi:hypothetical protein
MKLMTLTFLLTCISSSSFADTFSERQQAIDNRAKQEAFDQYKQQVVDRNQLFLKKLRQVLAAHRGAKDPIACLTELGEFAQGGFGEFGGSYSLSGQGLTIEVRFATEDANRGYQPKPASCSIDMNDGDACEFGIIADGGNSSSDDVHLESTCISPSLKKSTVNLGPILR